MLDPKTGVLSLGFGPIGPATTGRPSAGKQRQAPRYFVNLSPSHAYRAASPQGSTRGSTPPEGSVSPNG